MAVAADFKRATAWVRVDGRFPFMVGPDATGRKLGVVRLGGALEDDETPWEGACRELMEEACLRIVHREPPRTYRSDPCGALQEVAWDATTACPAPIVFSPGRGVTFLATSGDQPLPAGESHGLSLLTAGDITRLCSETLTLAAFLRRGGTAISNPDLPDLDRGMELDPKGPRVLKRVLDLHPELGRG